MGMYLLFVWDYYSANDSEMLLTLKIHFATIIARGDLMDKKLHPMIFKRKSFHIFKDIGTICGEELTSIERFFSECEPLIPDIKVGMKIVPAERTTCKRGQEYCILLYSEIKDGHLTNIGYIGQQIDLYLASMDIGSLWFGIGKTEDSMEGMEFVIMIAIAKMEDSRFRKNMFKSKRKPLEEIWFGEHYLEIANIARFAPSACNTQPWIVESSERELKVYRYKKPGKRGIMPVDKVIYYNRIDIGIFLSILELCLEHEGISFDRTLFTDDQDDEKVLNAIYAIK